MIKEKVMALTNKIQEKNNNFPFLGYNSYRTISESSLLSS